MNSQDFISIGINIGLLIIVIVFIKDLSKQNILIANKISLKINSIMLMVSSILVITIAFFLETFLPLVNNIFIIQEQENLLNPINWVLSTCLIAPILEEIIFRFGLYEKLKGKINNTFLIIILSIFFSVIHWYALTGFVIILIFAIILHLIYLKTNNLLNAILVHLIYNVIVLVDIAISPTIINFIIMITIIIISCVIFHKGLKNIKTIKIENQF